jgi:hypothetical protein
VAGQSATEFTAGVTYEITGPFRGDAVPAVTTTVAPTTEAPTTVPATEPPPTTVPATEPPQTVPATTTVTTIATSGGGSGGSLGGLVGGGVLAVALAGGYVMFRRWKNRPKDELVELEAEQPEPVLEAALPPVVVEPVVPAPVEESVAVVDPEPAPSFEEDESYRPILGNQLLEELPGGPSSARKLYDRSQALRGASTQMRASVLPPRCSGRPRGWPATRQTAMTTDSTSSTMSSTAT